MVLTVLSMRDIESKRFWTLQGWAAICIWLRFLFYLRTVSIFSWIVRMISECVQDMWTFLTLFIIGVMAWADAF